MANHDSITPVRGIEEGEEGEKVEMVEMVESERDLESGKKRFVLWERNGQADKTRGRERVFVLSFKDLQLCWIERLQDLIHKGYKDLSTKTLEESGCIEGRTQLDVLLERYGMSSISLDTRQA